MIEAARRVIDAGIELSVTVLLGVAGPELSARHAEETGRVLTAMDPHFAGALMTMLLPNTPLYADVPAGRFCELTPFELLNELAVMLEHTHMTHGLFTANHASNYLPLRIEMPHRKDAALDLLRRVVRDRDASRLKPESMRAL